MQAVDFIQELYSKYPKPLYLSKLGGILKQNHIIVDNLRELVESMEGFTVACGPEKERTAIAAVEDKEKIETLLNERAIILDSEALQFLSKLPRTLLFAFASKSKTASNSYFTPSPPYRFGPTKENEHMVEISRDLLLDAKIPVNLRQLPPDTVNQLHTNIKKWMGDNSIDLPAYVKVPRKSLTKNRTTLLEEIIHAIPSNQRSKVVLPLDIIGYLIKER